MFSTPTILLTTVIEKAYLSAVATHTQGISPPFVGALHSTPAEQS
jgi:hypothetical protein